MDDKEQDPQLQAPQEANTGKHINFMEIEESGDRTGTGNDKEEEESPTKKAWEQLRKDNNSGKNE